MPYHAKIKQTKTVSRRHLCQHDTVVFIYKESTGLISIAKAAVISTFIKSKVKDYKLFYKSAKNLYHQERPLNHPSFCP